MNRRTLSLAALAGAALLAVAASPAQASVAFADGNFADADWTAFTVTAGANDSFAAGQVAAGGNPGAYRQTTQVYYQGPGITVVHLNTANLYDPGVQGAVTSLTFDFDFNFFNAPGTGPAPSAAVGVGIVARQNGMVFFGATGGAATLNSWQHFNYNLTPADFGGLDLTSSGASVAFGYYTSNGTCCGGPNTTISGIDGWGASIENAPSLGVPEPATWALMIAGFGAAGALLRRRPAAVSAGATLRL